MDSRKPSLDLEKELTCSICTELLYQPLTLLDCLHTFCGACLKEWFRFQAEKAEKSPTPLYPDDPVYTCPSCRSTVRDTRHNATVVTLLDMYVAANPSKARSAADKEEMAIKYTPGDQLLPKVHVAEQTTVDSRAAAEDRRLIEEVREMSLRDATSGMPYYTRAARQRRTSHSVDAGSSRSSRNQSSDSRRHAPNDESNRQGSENAARERERRRRRRRSGSRQRHIEHQSSLRSLIGSSVMSERDIEREIEEFARQIQEEGLLDGLDLDNIDLTRDDELSRRITEAYRRRQRERSRAESLHRSTNSSNNIVDRSSETVHTESRLRAPEKRSGSRNDSRPANGNSSSRDRSRPPPVVSTNLEVRNPNVRQRRRTASAGRSATESIYPFAGDTRLAARSHTDLGLRSQTSDATSARQPFLEARSSSFPSAPTASPSVTELPALASGNNASFASRAPQWNLDHGDSPPTPPHEPAQTNKRRSHPPAELAIVHSAVSNPLGSPTASSGHRRTRSQLFSEPSIACSRCNKQHIEYELHYNCSTCSAGQWNICLSCYRSGKGCQYWFGFGYGAWKKWEKMRQQGDDSLATPHMLTASRYLPPPSTPGGADGRITLTANDPKNRLETGTFCARCLAWTNDCFWRCDICNEGDWGFCNNCVNHGKSCTHMLLPLTHEAVQRPNQQGASSSSRPRSATIYTGPQASSIGPFRPLLFHNRCEVCKDSIEPTHIRYHCFSCTSSLATDAQQGDYDICSPCYNDLVSGAKISAENGYSGWRRCLVGHRMAVIGFTEGKVGQWRFVERDIVGGRFIRSEPCERPELAAKGFQKWTWKNGDEKWQRLVSKDVSATAPSSAGSPSLSQVFPPDGGVGMRGNARWAWYPQAGSEDELLFPKGAEIREIEDVNGDWYIGTYMGAKGLFPAPYVQLGNKT